MGLVGWSATNPAHYMSVAPQHPHSGVVLPEGIHELLVRLLWSVMALSPPCITVLECLSVRQTAVLAVSARGQRTMAGRPRRPHLAGTIKLLAQPVASKRDEPEKWLACGIFKGRAPSIAVVPPTCSVPGTMNSFLKEYT